MPVQLAILGFLKDQDYYGYELKKVIQQRMGHWTDIKFGSIYHALKKLVEQGAVEKVGDYRESARPARTVYRITEKGRDEFKERLRGLLKRVEPVRMNFHVGLYFAGNLTEQELDEILAQRLLYFKDLSEALKGVRRMFINRHLPPLSLSILENSLFHLETEINWLERTREQLQEGKLLP